MRREGERVLGLAVLLWLGGLKVWLGIGAQELRIYYGVFGTSNEVREDVVLLPLI